MRGYGAVAVKAFITSATNRLRTLFASHRDFVLILVLFVAFRQSALWVFKPGGYLGEMSDFGYYRLLLSFTNQGFYPLIDFWVEYPPVFPWLMLGLYRLSLLIPAWTQPGIWFYLLLSTFLVLVEACNVTVLYALARRLHGTGPATRLAWIYSALLIPVLTLLGWYDGLALLLLLLAVLWTLDNKPISSGVAAGIGFMTKLVPIVAIPAAWQHMKARPQRLKLILAAILAIVLIAAPFLAIAPEVLVQSLKAPIVRSTWETVWALIDGYYSYGVAGGFDRFDPAMAGAAQHPTRLPWTLISIGFALLYLVLFTRRVDWADARRVVAFTALGQNLLSLYFKGYSPQFLVMLLPFILLLIPGWRRIAYVLLLSAVNLVEYPIYFLVLPTQHWLLAGTVLLRTLILVVLSLEYAAQVYGWRIPQKHWNRVAAAVSALVLTAGLVGSILGLQAYAESRYAASSHRSAMETLRSQAAPGAFVVVGEMEAYEEIYPFLRKEFHPVLIETFGYLPAWEPRLSEIARRSPGQVWLYTRADSAMFGWMAERYPLMLSHDQDGWRLSGWQTR